MTPEQSQENTFTEIIQKIQKKNPFQRKMIDNELKNRDQIFWSRVDRFAKGFESLLAEHQVSTEKVADCYVKLCKDMLAEQIKFKKTGKYSSSSFEEVAQRVYNSKTEMEAMVYGLAVSQFLWQNHYQLFDYFINTLEELSKKNNIGNYLEIGPGHGLHLVESVKKLKTAHFDVVDISETSLSLTKKVIKHFIGNDDKISFIHQDIQTFEETRLYDLVVVNEVLEHLEDPLTMMKCIHRLLNKDGLVFLTTCANAPSIDHIFLYDSVEDMQEQIQVAGFEIITEKILPVGPPVPRELWKEQKVEVNYGALCRKKKESRYV